MQSSLERLIARVKNNIYALSIILVLSLARMQGALCISPLIPSSTARKSISNYDSWLLHLITVQMPSR